jgi:rhamnosyltransferase subunit B
MRIIIATVGSLGDLFPFLAIGQTLVARGHRVGIATHGLHREPVERAGLDFIDASGLPEPEDRQAYMARAFHALRGPRFVVRDLAAADTAASYQRLLAHADVDVIVTTTLAFAGQLIGETGGVAWVSAVLAPAGFISAYDPPATSIGVLDRYLRSSPERGRWLARIGEKVTYRWTKPVRDFRRQLGLAEVGPQGDPFHRGQHAPAAVLALFPAMLGTPQPDWPAQVRQCGFARYDQPSTPDPTLESFLDGGAPPIVFTLGSAAVFAGARFLRESAKAAERLGRRAIVLTGSAQVRAQLPALPASILAVDYANHRDLFPRAAVVVHHGGIGTSAEALYAGIPMLVVPHGFDQPDNAARLHRLGVAEVLPIGRYRAARAASCLERLLGDERYRDIAQACATALAHEEGAARAADVIEHIGSAR